ncbi:MAG: hydrogenase maturation nickel metallochaperone HypA [Methanobacteriota archaeon]|nr:MAG: hydrogenase maturation nickel metallochaperone HypA [Euryarchaeota archaeon]
MHEFSVMSQIVASVMDEANARNASKIDKVTIELGEFTMLGHDQLRFAFEVLAKNTMLEGAVLDLQTTRGEIECGCGFKGEASPPEDGPHQLAASFECPKCGELAKVTGGRDCVIRNISMVVPGV